MSKEEFDAIMADSHDTMVDNRMDTAWGIISKLQAENAEMKETLSQDNAAVFVQSKYVAACHELYEVKAEVAELRGNIKNMSEFIKSISKDVFNQYVRYMDEKNNNK